jgi:colanic acid/amylovoran biosynthesis protein
MNIVIINQHAGNHGDEAAGKGLLKGIREKIDFNLNNITIIYNKNTISKLEEIDDTNINHVPGKILNKFEKIIAMITFLLPFFISKILIKFSPILSRELEILKGADKIINAPGGVNMGPYRDWRYLWRLYVSLKLKKDVAIYSISFGPIPSNIIFNKISRFILNNVSFLSIRDNKSQKFADDMKLKYIKSIDTAFLGYDAVENLPSEISSLIKDEYVVIVPNEVQNWGGRNQWHHNFTNCNAEDLDRLYIDIINYMLSLNKKVYLLPQLYGAQDDITYFNYLKEKVNNENIVIIDETYNSNIQQRIVKNAQFLVGARYHSVIFAVNNKTPMLSLSYEHKMTNTLEILGLEKQNLDLPTLLKNKNINVIEVLEKLFDDKDNCFNSDKSNNASNIARKTMAELHKFLLNN